MFHFGQADHSIPEDAIAQHRQKQPHAAIYVYEGAGHAFNRDVDNHAYDRDAAMTAGAMTLAFFEENLR
jgi:carboxymethylenebutenolidase